MDKKQTIHDLAVGMAQVYLSDYRKNNHEDISYSEETRYYIKSYLHALRKINDEYEDVEID